MKKTILKRRSPAAAALREAKFRPRIVRSAKAYTRKGNLARDEI